MIPAEHPAVAALVREAAARWHAGVFLCGSRLLRTSAGDHDYRLVVEDLRAALADTAFLDARPSAPLPSAIPPGTGAAGLRFAHAAETVSIQVLSRDCVHALASLVPFTLRIVRTTETYRANIVHGFHGTFSTEQRHTPLGAGVWCVDIDQSPWQHGAFATQVYHNMLIASHVLRDAHDLAASRRALIDAVRALARSEGLADVEAFARLLGHSTRRIDAEAREAFIRGLLTGAARPSHP